MIIQPKQGSSQRWLNPFRKSDSYPGAKQPSFDPTSCHSTAVTASSFPILSSFSSLESSIEHDSAISRKQIFVEGEITSSTRQLQPRAIHGYTDAQSDSNQKISKDVSVYEYGDAAPTSTTAAYPDYGYGNAAPDSAKYDYGDASPDAITGSPTASRVSRRSSMKGASGRPNRRASIAACGSGQTLTVQLPGKRQPVQRRRSITFNEEVKVQSVVPAKLMTEHPEDLWFQEQEYHAIKTKTVALIQRVSLDRKVGDKKYCTRGLEKWMEPENLKIKKRLAWDNVLNEQYLQRHDGEFDDEQIALMYKNSTARSQLEAAKRAKQDAEEAQLYLHSARRKMNRRMSM
jgi:hypothetical protein